MDLRKRKRTPDPSAEDTSVMSRGEAILCTQSQLPELERCTWLSRVVGIEWLLQHITGEGASFSHLSFATLLGTIDFIDQMLESVGIAHATITALASVALLLMAKLDDQNDHPLVSQLHQATNYQWPPYESITNLEASIWRWTFHRDCAQELLQTHRVYVQLDSILQAFHSKGRRHFHATAKYLLVKSIMHNNNLAVSRRSRICAILLVTRNYERSRRIPLSPSGPEHLQNLYSVFFSSSHYSSL